MDEAPLNEAPTVTLMALMGDPHGLFGYKGLKSLLGGSAS